MCNVCVRKSAKHFCTQRVACMRARACVATSCMTFLKVWNRTPPRGVPPGGGPFSHFLQKSKPLRGQNSAATAAAAVFGLHHPVFALSTPETHFRTTFLRFRTTFLRFRQLFNKIFKNFYVLTLLFYKIIKKSGYPGGTFGGVPGVGLGGGSLTRVSGGVYGNTGFSISECGYIGIYLQPPGLGGSPVSIGRGGTPPIGPRTPSPLPPGVWGRFLSNS